MSEREAYSTDLSDERWALIEPVLLAWKAQHPSASGHVGGYAYREIVNAIVYQNRTGCQWHLLPHDLPPKSAVKYYFSLWRDDGTTETIMQLLRTQVRERAGRAEDPSAVVIDSQSVRVAVGVPAATTGKDAAKKVPGRKRGIAVDVIGLILAVVVVAASVHDNAIGTALLDQVHAGMPGVTKAWVDQGFKNTVVEHGAALGIDVEIVARNPADGFVVQARRWIVEQTLGTLMMDRRLTRDYEHAPASSACRVHWSAISTITRRLTAQSTPTWRAA